MTSTMKNIATCHATRIADLAAEVSPHAAALSIALAGYERHEAVKIADNATQLRILRNVHGSKLFQEAVHRGLKAVNAEAERASPEDESEHRRRLPRPRAEPKPPVSLQQAIAELAEALTTDWES